MAMPASLARLSNCFDDTGPPANSRRRKFMASRNAECCELPPPVSAFDSSNWAVPSNGFPHWTVDADRPGWSLRSACSSA